jgi:hypothetical protein
LIASRLLVLRDLRQKHPDLSPFDWLCIQRSRNALMLFRQIYSILQESRGDAPERIYKDLTWQFHQDSGRYIFDESQVLLDTLVKDFHSPRFNRPWHSLQCVLLLYQDNLHHKF